MIYQINPKHGYHMATTKQEADSNEKHGWRTVTEKEFWDRPKKTAPAPQPLRTPVVFGINLRDTEFAAKEAELAETPEETYVRKFGKKPHHRMKPETIEAAINANLV